MHAARLPLKGRTLGTNEWSSFLYELPIGLKVSYIKNRIMVIVNKNVVIERREDGRTL